MFFFYLVRPVPGLESGPQQLVQLGPGLTQQHDTPGKKYRIIGGGGETLYQRAILTTYCYLFGTSTGSFLYLPSL